MYSTCQLMNSVGKEGLHELLRNLPSHFKSIENYVFDATGMDVTILDTENRERLVGDWIKLKLLQ